MTEAQQPPPFFVADNPALDFLNSVCAPRGTAIEWLRDGDDFLAWLEAAKMISSNLAGKLREKFASEDLDKAATKARGLREWFRGFVAAYAGTPLDVSVLPALIPLNKILAYDNFYHQVELGDSSRATTSDNPFLFQLQTTRRWHSAEDLVLPIAQAIGRLICEMDFQKIKPCEGAGCTLWFYDVSKNHTRRWCSMSVCGNRAKAAAHRAKKGSNKSSE